uniref:Uncharacterized protein n=1 Tax=Lepeophtheirus salmonis TaxID=72036 RepID=A0A0K2V7X8_LEPSM
MDFHTTAEQSTERSSEENR